MEIKKRHENRKPTASVGESLEERHSDDMHEVISKVPNWLLQWGISIFFGILVSIVAISMIIRYPDTIDAALTLTSTEAISPVNSPLTGKIITVFVKQGAVVKKGQPLVDVESGTDPGVIYSLKAPATGRVGFVAILQKGQMVGFNRQLAAIHPLTENIFGVLMLPSGSIGKIKIGQHVLINFAYFQKESSGDLTGIVSFIADEPNTSGLFAVKVTLPNRYLNKTVEIKPWMSCKARVITEDVSLQARVFKSITRKL